MTILDFPQLSPEWFAARKGKVSASQAHRLITPKTGKTAAAASEYLAELLGEERSLLPPPERIQNGAMKHGQDCEPEARRVYGFLNDETVQEVGLCVSDCGRLACSPDGIMPATRRGLELKCPQAKTHVSWLLAGGLPDEHKAQVHLSLIVTDYDSWDFFAYHPGLPPLRVTVVPDKFTSALYDALADFLTKLDAARTTLDAL